MTEFNLTKQEILNRDSFSNQRQLRLYDSDNLKKVETDLLNKWLPKEPVRILDLGCGAGRTTINLQRLGHQVIGIDIAPVMIELANKKYPDIDFRVMDACQLDFPDNSFDLVLFSYNSLDYIYPLERRWQALSEVRRVLKSGGLYIMSSHSTVVWPSEKFRIFWWVTNIFSGRIFSAYKIDVKGFKYNIKFVYFARQPWRQVRDLKKRGFDLMEIYACPRRKWCRDFMAKTKNMFWVSLLSEWPYYVFKKRS